MYGLNRLRKRPWKREFDYWLLQGLKPDVDLIGFCGMTEVMPCYKASRNRAMGEFFRSL
jgi:hypothetical protein